MKPPLPIPLASVDAVRWKPRGQAKPAEAAPRRSRPTDPKEVYRAAQILVMQHGQNAAAVASRRRDAIMAGGDVLGMATWRLIQRTIEELQRVDRQPSEKIH
jgi:hypothetical protein